LSGDRLASQLLDVGRRSGLDACGFCSAEPFEQARAALEEGRQAGRAGGMQFTYRNPRRSCDPSRSLEGARSLVVGAKAYARSPRRNRPRGAAGVHPAGSVAMYSWSDHYRVLREALGEIAAHLQAGGWRAKVLVDDNALVDRAAAVRAGLGWYGKNTNVLLPGRGSLFVLGSVVTDAPLGPFQAPPAATAVPGTMTTALPGTMTPGPVGDGCGSCRRCVQACPTGALDGEGHLDARLCLAWLLQAPGVFPRELRVAAGSRIYGCDDCQDVCPINRMALRRDPPPPAGESSLEEVDLIALLEADDSGLMRDFGRWYIPEREPKYLRRNALIALGNVGDPDSPGVRRALSGALLHDEPVVRAHAVWAASRLGMTDLLGLVRRDGDPDVRQELAALAAAGAPGEVGGR
jgi:epoxyqueuosine reductase